MRRFGKPVAAAGLLFLGGCAHPITSHMSANRFDSPEASGRFGSGDVDGGFESGPQYTITSDATANPVDLSRPSFSNTNLDGFLAGNLGILKRLDVGMKINFDNTSLAEVKYQILGSPRISAKKGNFSLAATLAGGGATHNDTSTSVELFGGTPITSTTALTETDYDAALIAGYRFTDHMLVYGGPFWTRRTFSGDISQTGGATGTTDFSGVFENAGANIGIQGDANRFLLRVEGATSRAWVGPLSYWGGYFGIEGGVTW